VFWTGLVVGAFGMAAAIHFVPIWYSALLAR
jgi:hypothetical protein